MVSSDQAISVIRVHMDLNLMGPMEMFQNIVMVTNIILNITGCDHHDLAETSLFFCVNDWLAYYSNKLK